MREPVYPERGLGTRSCKSLHAHDGHIWYHEGIGYWNCDGCDGSISVGDRYWWYSFSDARPMTRHKVVAELTKYYGGGGFECTVVDTGDHPEFDNGDVTYANYHELVGGRTGWHRVE